MILRFFSFQIQERSDYKTPLKKWLNDTARQGRKLRDAEVIELKDRWQNAITASLVWFEPNRCFRRPESKAINRALFDLIMYTASQVDAEKATAAADNFRMQFFGLLEDDEFQDLISRSVDHKKRTDRRFEMWLNTMSGIGL